MVVTRTVRKKKAPEKGPAISRMFLLSSGARSRLVVVVPVRNTILVLAPLMVLVYSLRLNLLGSGEPIMTSLKLDLSTSCCVLVVSGMTTGCVQFSLARCVETHLPESVFVSMTRVCFTWSIFPSRYLVLDGTEAADVSTPGGAGGASECSVVV